MTGATTARATEPAGSVPDTSSVAVYLAGFVLLGMIASFIGPSLEHLRERTGVGIGQSGLLLGAMSIGYIIASLLAGRAYDRGNGHVLWASAAVAASAVLAGILVVDSFAALLVLFALLGGSGGVMDVGGNTLVVWSRTPETVGSALNALHLCFGVGALSSPLLVSRSLLWTDGLGVFVGVVASGCVLLAVVLRHAPAPAHRDAPAHDPATHTSRRGLLALVCLFFVLYVGLEAGFAGWVHTYAEEIRLGDVGTAGVLTSVFWAGFSAGRIAAIWLARRLDAVQLLVGSCVAAVVAIGVMAVADGNHAVVWGATAVFGATVGPQFPTMIAYGDQRLQLTGSATSLIIAASGLGGLLLPVGIGWLLDRYGAAAMPRTIAVAMVLATGLVVVIDASARALTARQRPPVTSTNAPVT